MRGRPLIISGGGRVGGVGRPVIQAVGVRWGPFDALRIGYHHPSSFMTYYGVGFKMVKRLPAIRPAWRVSRPSYFVGGMPGPHNWASIELVGTDPHLYLLHHSWRSYNNNETNSPRSPFAACLRSVTLLLRPTWLPVLAVARRRTPKRRYQAAGAFATAWRGLSNLESRPRLGSLGSLGSEGCARWTTGP